MGQRKKNQNKENFRAVKKTTLQQIQYTQQLHIPTLTAMDLRQAGRSIELKKSSSKKTPSRKSRCISVKQAGPAQNLKLKQLLKQFKSMKLIQEKSRERSREKSPLSSKSRPKTRKSTKKITQLNSKNSSELNLTAKLEKTIKKLREDNFFRDEQESEIPLVSTSDAYTESERKRIELVMVDNEDEINIGEMRLFSKNSDQHCFRYTMEQFKSNVYDAMARKIQRAWRQYRTQSLVRKYTNIFMNLDLSDRSRSLSSLPAAEGEEANMKDIKIQSEQLYPEEMEQRKVTYISNLQEESAGSSVRKEEDLVDDQEVSDDDRSQQDKEDLRQGREDQVVERQDDDEMLNAIKKKQLQQWKEIITMISNTSKDNPADTEKLFQKLVMKSQLNKLNLESNLHDSDIESEMASGKERRRERVECERNSEQQEDDLQAKKQKHQKKQNLRSSSHSGDHRQDEFNSKKYIQYLDSDMYPVNDGSATICKEKQEQLLMKLTEHSSRKLIHASKLLESGADSQQEGEILSRLSHRSISNFSAESSQLDDELISERRKNIRPKIKRQYRNEIRKSTSEKIFKKIKEEETQIQVKQAEPEQFQDRQYNTPTQEERDIEKINETLEEFMRKELDEYEFEPMQEVSDSKDFDKCFSEEELSKKLAQLKRLREEDSDEENPLNKSKGSSQSDVAPILQRSKNPPLHRINIEDYDRDIESDEDMHENDIGERAEAVTDLMFNILMTEVLRDISQYPTTILIRFKEYSTRKTNRVRRAPTRNLGFPTNQAEIKLFIDNLCNYVLNEEPHVFKNLQKATGPSALEMLRYMHQSAEDQIYLDDEQDDPSVMVLPNWIFDNYWTRIAGSLKYQRQGIEQERQNMRQEHLKSLNKIFLRGCFDCLNECLDFERNFGSFGRPFPWKKSHLFEHVKTLEETRKSVKNAQKKLFETSATYCGIIIEREEMLSLSGSEEYVGQVQEDRLSRMLAQDLMEGEDRWIFYDDEETELLVECGNAIFYELLLECCQVLGRSRK